MPTTAPRIPRILHQTFRSGPLPDALAENAARLRALNPGWSYRFYGDEAVRAYIRDHGGREIERAFDAINPAYGAARADLFRYLLMYREGGVYLDIKSAAERPLDEVIAPGDAYVLSRWRNGPGEPFENFGLHAELGAPGGEFQQWHIVAEPAHPFLAAVLEQVLRNIRRYNPGLQGVGQLGVLRVTGPIAYTSAILPRLASAAHRLADSERELGFRYSIFGREGHKTALGVHYSVLTEPVARVSPATRVSAAVFNTLRAVKHSIAPPSAVPGRPQLS